MILRILREFFRYAFVDTVVCIFEDTPWILREYFRAFGPRLEDISGDRILGVMAASGCVPLFLLRPGEMLVFFKFGVLGAISMYQGWICSKKKDMMQQGRKVEGCCRAWKVLSGAISRYKAWSFSSMIPASTPNRKEDN